MKRTFIIALSLLLAVTAEAKMSVSRPATEDGAPIKVSVSVFIIDVDGIDSAEQNFTANVFFKARWIDPRLAHNKEGKIAHDTQDVWNPRLQAINRQKVFRTLPEIVSVTSDGECVYRQRLWGQFSQPLHLEDFPFDQQEFTLFLGAAGYTPNEIEFVQDTNHLSGIADELSLADWDILGWEAVPEVYRPTPETESVAAFRLTFKAQRESGHYIVKVLVPLVFIVMMSWVVFWIDPRESGTQIGVSMTAMLTLIAYRFAVGADVPKISYLTRMDYFILASTIIVFASLAEVIATSYLARKDKLRFAQWLDRTMRIVFPAVFIYVTIHAFVL